ncbi:hypothetical protein BC831DRAFT_6476 [Entophlyctis helioformis]|nr:hypothetical protein BC831DRAFT_6476 [Entophlyctis helioformis]
MLGKADEEHFGRYGFVVVTQALSEAELAVLVDDCDQILCTADGDLLNDLGCVVEPVALQPHLDTPDTNGSCHAVGDLLVRTSWESYLSARSERSSVSAEALRLVCTKIAGLASTLIPHDRTSGSLWLLNEQYIVKPPLRPLRHQAATSAESAFAWHHDSSYMASDAQHTPTVSCWIALDDIDESNGGLRMRPYPYSGPCSSDPCLQADGVQGSLQGSLQDAVRTFNNIHMHRYGSVTRTIETAVAADAAAAGIPLSVQRGSIVFMSGFVEHCSTTNRSGFYRRAFMPQLSTLPVFESRQHQRLVGLALPASRLPQIPRQP